MRHSVILFVATLTLSVASSAVELLRNGGAEDDRAPWGGDCHWETTPGAARSGAGCFRGEVTKPNAHQRLTQTVRLEGDLPYRVRFWARSDNNCSVVLWAESGAHRVNLGRWEPVPARWREYQAVFTLPADGDWELQFIVPSSHGKGTLGRAWVDDLSLRSLAVTRPTRLSSEAVIADQVTVATGPDGTVYAAWEEFVEGRDQLRVQRLSNDLTPSASWAIDFGPVSFTLWPTLVGGPAGVWLLTAAEVDRRWDIIAVPVTADGLGEPLAVTTDVATDLRVTGAVDDGGCWLAWETNRGGRREVAVARLAGGRVSAVETVSGPSAYNPNLVWGGNRLHLLYDKFVDMNRDIYLRVHDGAGWGEERRVTAGNRNDLNPFGCWWRGGLWVAWEQGIHLNYRIGSQDRKGIVLAQVTADGLAAPDGWAGVVEGPYAEQPRLLVDSQDRLHLVWRQARGDNGRGGWDSLLACYAGSSWSETRQVTTVGGRSRRAGATTSGSKLVLAAQSDNVLGAWRSHDEAAGMWSRAEYAVVDTADAALPPAADLRTVPLVESDDETFGFAALQERMGTVSPPFTFEHDGRLLTAYWGNFHEHSDISICARGVDQRVEEDYISMREIGQIDFGAVTDHGYNLSAPIWRYSAKVTRAHHDDGRFMAFVGEEWTSNNEKETKPPGYYGHRNLIFADPYHPNWYNSRDPDYFRPDQVWDVLAGINYIMIPHQLADAGTNVPIDWDYTHEQFQPVAEIFQARESYEADDAPRRTKAGHPGYFLQDVWARGVKIGVIASPDHGGGRGKAGVLVDSLSRERVLDACRDRHTWGTSAAKIAVACTVAGHLMGDAARRSGTTPVRVRAKIAAAGEIAAVRVIRSNQIIYSHEDPGPEVTFEFIDNQPPAGTLHYYLRVERADGELAWTSPVWLEADGA